MTSLKPKLRRAERDHLVVEVITRARNAMMLLQGTKVVFGRKSGFLNFEKEILKLNYALQIMGLDTPTPTFQQPGSEESGESPKGSRRAKSS